MCLQNEFVSAYCYHITLLHKFQLTYELLINPAHGGVWHAKGPGVAVNCRKVDRGDVQVPIEVLTWERMSATLAISHWRSYSK